MLSIKCVVVGGRLVSGGSLSKLKCEWTFNRIPSICMYSACGKALAGGNHEPVQSNKHEGSGDVQHLEVYTYIRNKVLEISTAQMPADNPPVQPFPHWLSSSAGLSIWLSTNCSTEAGRSARRNTTVFGVRCHSYKFSTRRWQADSKCEGSWSHCVQAIDEWKIRLRACYCITKWVLSSLAKVKDILS